MILPLKFPTAEEVQQTIDALKKSGVSDTQRALNTFTSFVRMQPFWDGNERTAMLLANKDLITHGRGLLVVTEKNGLISNDTLSQLSATADPFLFKSSCLNNVWGA